MGDTRVRENADNVIVDYLKKLHDLQAETNRLLIDVNDTLRHVAERLPHD